MKPTNHSDPIMPVVVFVLLTLAFVIQSPAWATTAESKYKDAQQCASQLQDNAAHQKYRHRWLQCIQEFLGVYRHDPHGPWAAAGLYQAGVMYGELYGRSYLEADKQEASDLLDKVIRHFPASRYSPKAQVALQALQGQQRTTQLAAKSAAPPTGQPKAKNEPPKSMAKTNTPGALPAGQSGLGNAAQKDPVNPSANDLSARKWYEKGQISYQRLQQKPELQKFRDPWLACINPYRKAYQADPDGVLAPAALFGIASSYNSLHKWSRLSEDSQEAEKAFEELIRKFPDSPYAGMAKATLNHKEPADAALDGIDNIGQVIDTAGTDAAPASHEVATATSEKPAVVESIRFWSNPRYTRVVIDANKNTEFSYRELREDPSISKPQRIYVDVLNSRLSKDLQKVVTINDNLLSDARAGQYAADTVRVVVDIKSAKTFKLFSLKNPYRIVLDVWGMESEKVSSAVVAPPAVTGDSASKLPASAIVKQLALGVRRIVIDPGHGGKDYGAPGYIKGVHEKDVALDIGKRLAQKMRSELKCDVVLTRNTDTYLSLEERTAIANTQNADLFLSIHTNAAPDRQAHGIETFMLNLATDDESIRVAARENATSMKNISDLHSILKDLMQNAKVNESARLASYVQQATLNRLDGKYDNIRNKGVKQAPFYVLLGADMPSILIETSFISNPRECQRLISGDYQELLCRGIVEGVRRYVEETNPVASWRPEKGRGKGSGG